MNQFSQEFCYASCCKPFSYKGPLWSFGHQGPEPTMFASLLFSCVMTIKAPPFGTKVIETED